MKKKAKISIILLSSLMIAGSLYVLIRAQSAPLRESGLLTQSLKSTRMRNCWFFDIECTSLEQKLKSISDQLNEIKDKTTKQASAYLTSAAAFLKTPEVIACKRFGACSSLAKWLIRSIEAVLIVAGVIGIGWYLRGKQETEEVFDLEATEKDLKLLNTNITNLNEVITFQNPEEIKKCIHVLMENLLNLSQIFPPPVEMEEILLLQKQIDSENIIEIANKIAEKAIAVAESFNWSFAYDPRIIVMSVEKEN